MEIKQLQMNYYIEVAESIKKYIERNIEHGVSPDKAAKVANYSLKQLNRIFFMVTGLTISEYIRWNRLAKALFELKHNDASIINIALKYGYESQEAFTRAFKENFNVPPGECRKPKREFSAKNWHVNQFIHQTAHNFLIEILSALQGLSKVKTPEAEQILKRLSAIFQKNATNWLDVDPSHWGSLNSHFFSDFKTAILERRIAEFDYYTTYGKITPKKSRRRIEPIQLRLKSRSWYIIGFCLTRQEIRTFKLTRIRNLTISGECFPERDLPAIHASASYEQKQCDATLKLKIKPEMADRVYDEFDESIVEKQSDGSFIVSIGIAAENNWAHGMILSYGEHIEVLEPESVRKAIKDKVLKMSRIYF
ncbi:MAG: WYL domain-containing protein [Fibromonadaceae bacterium]|jgi:predicted DNA-binding transcriptional regulator YafY/AraC-like DNA-binding protein|nr:WYL domain-containing protein [Fibromonadaceae bacterium]